MTVAVQNAQALHWWFPGELTQTQSQQRRSETRLVEVVRRKKCRGLFLKFICNSMLTEEATAVIKSHHFGEAEVFIILRVFKVLITTTLLHVIIRKYFIIKYFYLYLYIKYFIVKLSNIFITSSRTVHFFFYIFWFWKYLKFTCLSSERSSRTQTSHNNVRGKYDICALFILLCYLHLTELLIYIYQFAVLSLSTFFQKFCSMAYFD